jgi:hypothetical protein
VTRGSVRREVRIAAPARTVWDIVSDPVRIVEWWPGVTDATLDGDVRTVVLATGLAMPEQILTRDAIARRFQYRITAPMVREHLSTIDVFDLGDDTCLAAYAADADPSTMALIIGAAGGNALQTLRDQLEGTDR